MHRWVCSDSALSQILFAVPCPSDRERPLHQRRLTAMPANAAARCANVILIVVNASGMFYEYLIRFVFVKAPLPVVDHPGGRMGKMLRSSRSISASISLQVAPRQSARTWGVERENVTQELSCVFARAGFLLRSARAPSLARVSGSSSTEMLWAVPLLHYP